MIEFEAEKNRCPTMAPTKNGSRPIRRRICKRWSRKLDGDWRRDPRKPEHGGYPHVTAEERAQWDADNAAWQTRRRDWYRTSLRLMSSMT
jgi:hypothetical protein